MNAFDVTIAIVLTRRPAIYLYALRQSPSSRSSITTLVYQAYDDSLAIIQK